MAESWGHTMTKECPYLKGRQERFEKKIAEGDPYARYSACSVGTCVKRPEWACSYLYITGKLGRISRNDKYYCEEHAEKFAQKYGVQGIH